MENMEKAAARYEDWLLREDLSPLELALLMADTCPDWPLGKDILAVYETDDATRYQDFCSRYENLPQQWAFFEKFQRSRKLVFKGIRVGSLAGQQLSNGRLRRDAAIDFVFELDDRDGREENAYDTFVSAAIDLGLIGKAPKRIIDGGRAMHMIDEEIGRPWWQTNYDLDEIVASKSALYRERQVNLHHGKPNKKKMALEIMQLINSTEERKGRERRVGQESLRGYLKGRDL